MNSVRKRKKRPSESKVCLRRDEDGVCRLNRLLGSPVAQPR